MPAPDAQSWVVPMGMLKGFVAPEPAQVLKTDLELRVEALEERARREDGERAARERLRALGLIVPGDPHRHG